MRDKIEIPTELFVRMAEHVAPSDEALRAKVKPYLQLAQLPRYYIAGRRWFQKSAGNTYHRTLLYENDKLVFDSGRVYGYGEQYLQTAVEWLKKNRELPGEPSSSTIYIREVLHATWNVVDVNREKDL